MIEFKKVTKLYPRDVAALYNVTFFINKGEFVSIVGKSGAGKSTVLKLLIHEEIQTSGKVIFEDEDVASLTYNDLPALRQKIGMVFQDFKLLPAKTAYENVAFALEALGRPQKDIEEDVPQVLELVGLSDKMGNFPHELSGGERQRVSVARALVHRPKIIIADEPTGNLDPVNTKDIIDLFTKINQFGTTILLATHDKPIVDKLKRRVITLDQGKMISDEVKGKYIL